MEISKEIADYLNHKYMQYANLEFADTDPVQVPRLFTKKEDVEISGFLAATIAWGNRKSIITNAMRIIDLMGGNPYDFVSNANEKELAALSVFTHRTFNGLDFAAFAVSLKHIYIQHGGLEQVFSDGLARNGSIYGAICHFRDVFTGGSFLHRSRKHVADPSKGSAAKRINMYLRWMVRAGGADIGIWKSIPCAALMLPLDVHSGRMARALGILARKQDDWRAVEEVTGALRMLDPNDPVKYDYALFGIGVFEKDIFTKTLGAC
jgi:uncharacterized protein (TIGR02757 family)